MNKQEIEQVKQFLRQRRGHIYPEGHPYGPVRKALEGIMCCDGCDGNYLDVPSYTKIMPVEAVGAVCFGCAYLCAWLQLIGVNDRAKIQASYQFLRDYRGMVWAKNELFGLRFHGFRCDGCGGTYADYPDIMDSMTINGVGRLCMSCLYLLAQRSLLDEAMVASGQFAWSWDRRPRVVDPNMGRPGYPVWKL
jgi:hypothetical protein